MSLCGSNYILFEVNEYGNIKYDIDGHPYLNHIIELLPGDWGGIWG